MMDNQIKIIAIVVTYNRLNLLKRCVDHIRKSIRIPDEVIVVNNSSTDGTSEWLDSQKDIIHIKNQNNGGAGGFHRGIEEAIQRNADWIWLMDDDGYPDQMQLKILEDKIITKPASAWNAEVLDELNFENYAFGMLRINKDGKAKLSFAIKKRKDFQSYWLKDGTYPFACFFNGTLISKEALLKVGNVDKDMFIFGDEMDLFWRLSSYLPVFTVQGAYHYHPSPNRKNIPIWKSYYGLRNFIRIHNRYYNYSIIRNLKLILSFLLKFLKFGFPGLKYYFRAIDIGLRGDFSKDINQPFSI